ncbi:MAG: type II toxin-antitoxin system HicA family toxin [Bacteroidales bacterium]|jgi:predicted RNA binding protein YcfA (HicA-like mRNA interferase family)|nr:type II toxin-antitoxin system HicA family toxin [Bacteroidales bacterium]
MKTSELRRLLAKNGWTVIRNGARHDLFGHTDHPEIQIPVGRHGAQEIPTGTANKILKDAGIK